MVFHARALPLHRAERGVNTGHPAQLLNARTTLGSCASPGVSLVMDQAITHTPHSLNGRTNSALRELPPKRP